MPHAESAITDMGAPARLPDEMPEQMPITGIERPGIIGSRNIEDSPDRENRTFDVGECAGFEPSHAGNDQILAGQRVFGPCDQLRFPDLNQFVHVRAVDLRERAVAFARIITTVGRPVAGCAQRLRDLPGLEALGEEKRRQE